MKRMIRRDNSFALRQAVTTKRLAIPFSIIFFNFRGFFPITKVKMDKRSGF